MYCIDLSNEAYFLQFLPLTQPTSKDALLSHTSTSGDPINSAMDLITNDLPHQIDGRAFNAYYIACKL